MITTASTVTRQLSTLFERSCHAARQCDRLLLTVTGSRCHTRVIKCGSPNKFRQLCAAEKIAVSTLVAAAQDICFGMEQLWRRSVKPGGDLWGQAASMLLVSFWISARVERVGNKTTYVGTQTLLKMKCWYCLVSIQTTCTLVARRSAHAGGRRSMITSR